MENTTERLSSKNLLHSLIDASEKASRIARLCRANEKLLSLLVQEKTGEEANTRFQHDFKTLADVLIQETIKKDIGSMFPAMHDAIKGEESPSFTNKDGQTVSIEIGKTVEETANCLCDIMQDIESATALAVEVHRNVEYTNADLGKIPRIPDNVDYANLGVWIDPIDATAEYIAGNRKSTDYADIAAGGLDCVTVLIGVYLRDSGVPVIGVVSQPFFKPIDEIDKFESRVVWGVALPQLKAHNCSSTSTVSMREKPLAICSSSEQSNIINTLKDIGYDTVFSAGAGYKALKVINNDADLYILSKGSTFKWDTCAPQAILRALNGDMFDFQESITQQVPTALNYLVQVDESGDSKCNRGGIIAERNIDILHKLLPKLVT